MKKRVDARRTQEQRSAETQGQLLDATIELLFTRGYVRLTTNEIAAAAGVSRGALTHHFANKEDIVVQAIQRQLRGVTADLRRFAETLDGRDDVNAIVDYLWALMSDRLFYTTLEFLPEARHNPPFGDRLAEVTREFHNALDEIWAHVAAHTGTDIAEARVMFNSTMCLIRGMVAQTVLRKDPEYFADMLDFWKENLHRLLAGRPVSKRARA